jgi:hypothetical protein
MDVVGRAAMTREVAGDDRPLLLSPPPVDAVEAPTGVPLEAEPECAESAGGTLVARIHARFNPSQLVAEKR